MRRRAASLSTAIALLITLYLIWTKLRIVIFVNLPWWGFLLLIVVLFLAIDYVLDRVLRGR